MPSFLLNETVDHLLKKEFDIYRAQQKPHPVMGQTSVKMVPYQTDQLSAWTDNFKGIRYLVEEYNFLIFGAVDDVWQKVDDQKLVVVDYKATAKKEAVTELYGKGTYHDSYRNQVEIYQWLLMKNGFEVDPTAYFVYANGIRDKERFSNKIQFQLNLIAYAAKTDWIEAVIEDVYNCLQNDLPSLSRGVDAKGQKQYDCEHCAYVHKRLSLTAKKG